MVLNYIWIGFFLVAFVVAVFKFVLDGDVNVFNDIVGATFSSAQSAFEISIGLTGVLCLWLGIMNIGQRSGVVDKFARFAAPLFGKLFPEIPKDHPVIGGMFMNFSANMLGLDNAATPIGLNVMKELQELNPLKERASNAMIMFLVINASGLTLIPITIMMYRAQLGAANASDVFIPILISTTVATIVAITLVGLRQRINFLSRAIMIPLAVMVIFIVGIVFFAQTSGTKALSTYSSLVANLLLFGIICGFIVSGLRRKINVYDAFIEGAKGGFKTAITIIPYLVAVLVGIGVFRASGAMDYAIDGVRYLVLALGFDAEFVGALPTMIMKPLSGSGSRGMMIDAMTHYGADSLVGRLSCIVQGATDTSFYVVALYYGSVAIRNTRYTLPYALVADLVGIIASVFIAYLFFG